ncbi:uncharacterized protein F5891DRAFT_985174 [Suillus fuscotomentosus]|uniref:Uncharacterized protein n=1 Tax=Suillus fuscotomentosus TaxID=1912939 RepID=A0AAD4DV31_9AGAM|nr:uncharacterized protein F5891DRAFT_985174 [Suillus fuscotomentosus]KAG1894292.1 hypothetical protein F5891DRAFT_985174 [Suillus fuscotomentosus]
MVNNFNASMLEAVRCNMDIKFISSGASAKAILYYITDYITKSQLKAHVAYAALDLARRKLSEFDSTDDDLTVRAKELIRKCAHAMISHQELSAQQVTGYLMEFGDHYTSHEFRNLFWTSFENYVNAIIPLWQESVYEKECEQWGPDYEENDLSNEVGDDEDHCSQPPEEEECLQDIADAALGSDEVGLSVDDSGNLVPRANQVQDYQLRSSELRTMCVWDFVTQVEKQKVK